MWNSSFRIIGQVLVKPLNRHRAYPPFVVTAAWFCSSKQKFMTKLPVHAPESKSIEQPVTSGEHSLSADLVEHWKNDFMLDEATTVAQEVIPSRSFGTYLAGILLMALLVSIPIGLYVYRKRMRRKEAKRMKQRPLEKRTSTGLTKLDEYI